MSKIHAIALHRFAAPPEAVYDAWLVPTAIRTWMQVALRATGLAGDIQRVEVDAVAGGGFFFSDRRGEVEARHWGKYLELDRPRRIVFTWITEESEEADPSVVTLTIEPDGDGCVATIDHEMDDAWLEYKERVEQGWGRMLRAIASAGPSAESRYRATDGDERT
ncbi:MAG: SRPBCC domain-containing protein [Bryobacteraceae bacterium]